MKHEKLSDALDQISDKHLAEALTRNRRKPIWLGVTAAAAAILLLVCAVFQPFSISVKAISLADEPRIMDYPDYDKYKDKDQWRADIDRKIAESKQRQAATDATLASLTDFFAAGSRQFLAGSDENRLWSPANAYLGLAMLTELTDGTSRQQLLDLLGCADTDTLRKQASAVWESAYAGEKHEASSLASSLWLEKGLRYNQDTMDALSYHYYTSIYQGNLGSASVNHEIGNWLNKNTGGLLKSTADSIRLPENTVFALYATLYFQSKWVEEFRPSNNTNGTFHTPSGDKTVTYMNKSLAMMNYHRGDTYGAVSLSLKNGSQMWFILPDEGFTPEDVLQDEQYLQMLLSDPAVENGDNVRFMKVNLSVPKFDVTGNQNLKNGLEAMGVTDVFSLEQADFSAITSDTPIFLTAVNQAVRIQVDEQGVKAAAYIELPGATSPAPPDEIIDFVLDRPFLFVLTQDKVPLITGVVNAP